MALQNSRGGLRQPEGPGGALCVLGQQPLQCTAGSGWSLSSLHLLYAQTEMWLGAGSGFLSALTEIWKGNSQKVFQLWDLTILKEDKLKYHRVFGTKKESAEHPDNNPCILATGNTALIRCLVIPNSLLLVSGWGPRTSPRFSLWSWGWIHRGRVRAREITYVWTEMELSNRKGLSPGIERNHKVLPPSNTQARGLGLQHLFGSWTGEKTFEAPQGPSGGTKETEKRAHFFFFFLILVADQGTSIISLLGGLITYTSVSVPQSCDTKPHFHNASCSHGQGHILAPWLWTRCHSQSQTRTALHKATHI